MFSTQRIVSLSLLAMSLLRVGAQDEGQISGPTSSASAAGYSCDASQCKLPNCNCASTSPPGGLSPSDVPQFIVFTADDAVQSYTLDAVNQFLAQRKNPNGCTPRMTYYTSLNFTNYTLVTDWYVAGNEIADHTMTHVGTPPENEVAGNLIALNALAGIPLSAIKGFRAPFLNYSMDTLKMLAQLDFTYDSSSSASVPVTDPGTDAFWPYTLDNGMANDCLVVDGMCKGQPKLPGFWEIPMYAFFDNRGAAGPHLMDPWLDTANGASTVNDSATLEYMKNTFTAHYTGNRQPIGLYTHPIHLSQDVWIVSSEQLLSWVQNPTKVSDLNGFDALKCSTPQVDQKICNGMPDNEAGLLSHCAFSDFPFYTCYGCPETEPTPDDPNPAQQVADGSQARFRLPANCSTPFWDPINGTCVCTSDSCKFQDTSKPIGPNGANLTGGGTGGSFDPSASPSAYVPFNGKAAPSLLERGAVTGVLAAVGVVMVGAVAGAGLL